MQFRGKGGCSPHRFMRGPVGTKKMCYFALKTHSKEILTPVQINRMFESDFTETKEEELFLSYEDRRFLSKVN